MKIIDCHCHVYPPAIASRAVVGVADFYDGVDSFGDGLASSMKRIWQDSGVGHAVIFSVATRAAQVGSINAFISSTVTGDAASAGSDGGFFTGLGTVHQDEADMASVVDSIISLGLKGVKIHPDMQRFALDAPKTLEELLNTEPLFGDFSAVQAGTVWYTDKSIYQLSVCTGTIINNLYMVITKGQEETEFFHKLK